MSEVGTEETVVTIITTTETAHTVTTDAATVYTIETSPPVGEKGEQGEKGEPGVPGGVVVEYPAGHVMSGHRIVVLENGEAVYADRTVAAHANKILGMTTGAVIEHEIATIQTGGELTEPSWAWTLDIPVWLGTNGLLTQTVPTTGFSLIVGFPITATKIFIDIREPISLT